MRVSRPEAMASQPSRCGRVASANVCSNQLRTNGRNSGIPDHCNTLSSVRPGEAEVIVVGGGPAGALAALALARRGVDVMVLDKKRFPRDKPCGGGIRYGVYARFPDLAETLRSKIAIHEVRRVPMESPGGHVVVAPRDTPA